MSIMVNTCKKNKQLFHKKTIHLFKCSPAQVHKEPFFLRSGHITKERGRGGEWLLHLLYELIAKEEPEKSLYEQQRSQISTVSLRYTENLLGEQTIGCYSQIYIYIYIIKQIKFNKTEKE